uniref:Septin-type G domain-containing protein n=1 Tax=Oreochromis niloticus TaxID=8128 RepID=A0A669BVI0_ORENI
MIKQGGNQLTLTIVDAPDFGDAVDNSNTWQPIIYQTDRNGIYDITMSCTTLLTAAMWLTTASAGINYIEFMKRLHDKVNVIPLIAKADTLTPEEYKDDDNKLVQKIKEKMPLAVVGSNVVIEVNSKKVRGRQYPWGVAEVENGEHCDFCRYTNSFFYCSKDLTGVCTLKLSGEGN